MKPDYAVSVFQRTKRNQESTEERLVNYGNAVRGKPPALDGGAQNRHLAGGYKNSVVIKLSNLRYRSQIHARRPEKKYDYYLIVELSWQRL